MPGLIVTLAGTVIVNGTYADLGVDAGTGQHYYGPCNGTGAIYCFWETGSSGWDFGVTANGNGTGGPGAQPLYNNGGATGDPTSATRAYNTSAGLAPPPTVVFAVSPPSAPAAPTVGPPTVAKVNVPVTVPGLSGGAVSNNLYANVNGSGYSLVTGGSASQGTTVQVLATPGDSILFRVRATNTGGSTDGTPTSAYVVPTPSMSSPKSWIPDL